MPSILELSGRWESFIQSLSDRTNLCLLSHLMVSKGSDGKESACSSWDLGSIPGSGRSPGEENGNSLSILAWRILWTEEPGGLVSTGSQRIGHDWVTELNWTDTGVGCHALLQGIFLTRGLNLHLLHCRWVLYHWVTREAHGSIYQETKHF